MDFTPPPPPPRYSADNPEPKQSEELPAENEVHDELFEQSLRAADQAYLDQSRSSGWWLLLTLAFFVLSRLGKFDVVGTSLLVGVILLHEAGHFLGMKLFGYRDVKMFFVPFFGAAVTGRKHAAAAWQEIIVLMLGPMPGILLGTALYFAIHPTETQSHLYKFTWMLLSLNGFNLLPFMPLDGGRVMNLLIFRRHPALEVVFKLFAVAGLLLLAVALMSWVLAVVAIFILIGIQLGFKLGMRARRIKLEFPTISAEWNQQGVAEFHRLFQYSREVLPMDTSPPSIGKRMVMLHELASANSPSFLATIFYLCVFTVCFFIAPVVGVLMARDGLERREMQERRAVIITMVRDVNRDLLAADDLEKTGSEDNPLTEQAKSQIKLRRSLAKMKLDDAIGAARHNANQSSALEDEMQLEGLLKMREQHFPDAEPAAGNEQPPVP